MNSFFCKTVFAVLIALAATGARSAPVPDCGNEPEACIRLAAAETAAYVDECAKLFPDSRDEFTTALAKWSVRKLRIPGLEEALKPGSADRVAMGKKAAAYLKSVGNYERDIECNNRLAVLKNKEPRLRSDFVVLPDDPLEPYVR